MRLPYIPQVSFTLLSLALASRALLGIPAHAELLEFDFSPSAATVSEHVMPQAPTAGHWMRAEADRTDIRPGERWAEMMLAIEPPQAAAGNLELRATLTDFIEGQLIAEKSFRPTGKRGILRADLRSPWLSRAIVRVELLENGRPVDAAQAVFSAADESLPWPEKGVRVEVDFPPEAGTTSEWPVSFGVPAPAGTIWNADALRLVDAQGRPVPAQREVIAYWAPQGSVKWVRFETLAKPGQVFHVVADSTQPEATPSDPVRLSHQGQDVIIETAGVRYRLSAGPSPIAEIHHNNELLVSTAGARGMYVIDQNGRTASAEAQGTLEVEAAGPEAASVRIEGFYRTPEGEAVARHITRVEMAAGQEEARITHTLVLTRDSNDIWFREIGWELAVNTGDTAQALFNIDRADREAFVDIALKGNETAWMLQQDHIGIGPGANHFQVTGPGGQAVHEGGEMGDWAALTGNPGGLFINCREAARQHPKEYLLSPGLFNLKLFSHRAGEELDFRTETLIERWGVQEQLSGENLERFRQHTSNAIGWSKTHEILLAPLRGEPSEKDLAHLSQLHSERVYAHVDPLWIHQSGALGPLHPRDTANFPQAEATVDAYIERYLERVPGDLYYGFVDFHAGPHYGHAGRYRLTYSLLPDSWLLYARSGDRNIRAFAEGSNRAFMDNCVAHWDGPDKHRGLIISASGGTGGWRKSDFPFYWEERSSFGMPSTAAVDQSLHDYYLTGYRRAGDIVRQMSDAMIEHWTPQRTWRIFAVMRTLNDTYGFTWDPRLRALAEATTTGFAHDPDGEILVSKQRAYNSSTYKTPTDVEIMIDSWNTLGSSRHYDMARAVARHWWESVPISGRLSGAHANFLYRETGNHAIASDMAYYLRRASSAYDEETGEVDPGAFSQMARIFRGIPYAMDVLHQAGSTGELITPVIHVDDYGRPVEIIVWKEDRGWIDLTLRGSGDTRAGGRVTVEPVGVQSRWGLDLTRVAEVSSGRINIRIPLDAPEGAYRITPQYHGEIFALAHQSVPMVLHAPGYWRPFSADPSLPVYFSLPSGTERPQIFFEGTAIVRAPDGRALANDTAQNGWIDLPDNIPGLWSFEPVDDGLIRARNFPPFFAIGNPDFYFLPENISWKREKPVEGRGPIPAGDPEEVFVSGLSGKADDHALYLPAGRSFMLNNDNDLLPHKQGTIEFYFRPDWSSFDLTDGMESVSHRLVELPAHSRWNLDYRVDPQGTRINLGPREPAHSLYGSFNTRREDGRRSHLRVWATRTLFEPDEWVHIAWVWGERDVPGPHGTLQLPVMDIYVNGRNTRRVHFRSAAGTDPDRPEALILRGGPGAAIDHLHISDIQRYDGDFTPPPRGQAVETDAHSRAYFDFNKTLEGIGHSDGDVVIGSIHN